MRRNPAILSSALFDIRDDHDDEYVRELIFSRSASAAMPGDNRRMAATAEEGTAHKLVTCKCGRTMPNSEDRGDSRKDGILSNDQAQARRNDGVDCK